MKMASIAYAKAGKRKFKNWAGLLDFVRGLGGQLNPAEDDFSMVFAVERAWLQSKRQFITVSDDQLLDYVDQKHHMPLQKMLTVLREQFEGAVAFRSTSGDTYFIAENAGSVFMSVAHSEGGEALGAFVYTADGTEKAVLSTYVRDNPREKTRVLVPLYFLSLMSDDSVTLSPHYTEPKIKHGRVIAKGREVLIDRASGLTSTHTRHAFTRVLRAPCWYKDGVVPDEEALLRRVPVKECKVNRDINRCIAS